MIAKEDIKIGAVVRHLGGPDTWGDTDAEHFKLFTIVEDIGSLEKYFMENLVCRHAVAANKDLFELSTEFSMKALEPNNSIARPVLSERKVGKLRTDLFEQGFPLAIQEVCKALTWAKENKGYGDHDWQAIPDPEVCFSGAAARHRLKHNIQREVEQFEMLNCVDEESGIMHLCHQATNVLMELELALRGKIK